MEIDPKRTDLKARAVEHLYIDAPSGGQPGDIKAFEHGGKHAGYNLNCPGCGELLMVATAPLGERTHAVWSEHGSLAEGTLTISPSIWHRDDGCGWHGFLTDGSFRRV